MYTALSVCNTGILGVPGAHIIKTYSKQHIILKLMILKLFSGWILDVAVWVIDVKVLIKGLSLCNNTACSARSCAMH